jgi:cyclopropane-fatty-acyl-phospholipid synthase
MTLRRFLIDRIQRLLAKDSLPLRITFWDGESFDFTADPAVTLTINSPTILWRLMTGQIAKLGDAYVTGELGLDGKIDDVLQIGIILAKHLGKVQAISVLPRLSRRFMHSKRNDAEAIAHHYSISNDFYALWLDRTMTYSCAYFESGDEDLNTAQQQKILHICRKLRLKPNEYLLDVGCGWGGLLIEAAQTFGIRGLGVTNSEAQYAYACEKIRRNGLADKIDIRLSDYRDLRGSALFDKAVSVGMYEHVGLKNMQLYFDTVARLLKPGGAFLNHGIISTDPDGRAQGPPGGEFINQHVFPGGELSSLPSALLSMSRSRLEVIDIEDLRPHYARTLLLWLRQLEAARAETIAVAGIERYRIWRIFLAGMAYAFDRGWLSVVQVLTCKRLFDRPAPRAWSRSYQYLSEQEPCVASSLDWQLD